MNKTVVVVAVCLFSAMTVWAANNNFNPMSGDWNVAGNWSLGAVPDNAGTYGNPVVINASKTCTIQPETVATMDRILLGASAPGTLIVKGSLLYDWGNGIQLGQWSAGTGILKILGGTVGTASAKKEMYVGSIDDDHGTFQLGDGTLGGTGTFSTVYVNSDTNGSSLVDLQSGTLDATVIRLGDVQGTADTVKMKVSGTADINLAQLLVGVSAEITSATLEINGGNASIDLSSYFTFANGSDINLNFDSAGIAAVTGTKFYYGNGGVDVNIAATEDVPGGTYDLFVGTAGGSGHGLDAINFVINTNSFGEGKTLELLYEYTVDTIEAISLKVMDLQVPEIGDIDISVSGTNAVVSFDGASGFTYALQQKQDLASESWSNVVIGISGTGGTQNVSNGMSEATAFYRVVSE